MSLQAFDTVHTGMNMEEISSLGVLWVVLCCIQEVLKIITSIHANGYKFDIPLYIKAI
jgi:hypothetical protein